MRRESIYFAQLVGGSFVVHLRRVLTLANLNLAVTVYQTRYPEKEDENIETVQAGGAPSTESMHLLCLCACAIRGTEMHFLGPLLQKSQRINETLLGITVII